MHRLAMIAALALALPAAATAQSDGLVNATPGALGGRSPHHAYRPATGTSACPAAMHSLPSGKLPVYGSTLGRAGCGEVVRVADKGSSKVHATR